MTTTIPVDLGWLIVATFILIPALCFLATVEANHFYTRAYHKDMKAHRHDMKAREQAVREAEATIADQMLVLDERQDAVLEAEYALGRAAHDAATQAKAALYQATMDDTQIAMPRMEL